MGMLKGDGKPREAGRSAGVHTLPVSLHTGPALCLQKDLENSIESASPINPPEWTHSLLGWREIPFVLLLIARFARQRVGLNEMRSSVLGLHSPHPVPQAHPPARKRDI